MDSTTTTESPYSPRADLRDSQASSSAMIVESSKLLPWLMLCAMLSGISMTFASFCFYQLSHTEREYRLLQLQVQDQSAIMIREGLKRPEDQANGPTYEPRRK